MLQRATRDRCCAVLFPQVLSAAYLIWRAARSCPGGWLYLYSLPVLVAEISMSLLSNIFVLSLWSQLDRPARWLEDMMPANAFPTVDVYIVAFNGACHPYGCVCYHPAVQVAAGSTNNSELSHSPTRRQRMSHTRVRH